MAGSIGRNLAEAHARLLQDRSIQFELNSGPATSTPPLWLLALQRTLEMLGPVVGWIFWIGLTALVGTGLFFGVRRLLPRPGGPASSKLSLDQSDRPTPARAKALLEEADRLAAAERYGEGVHVLLARSIEDIRQRRPRAFSPSATVREIAGSSQLSSAARSCFSDIARVAEVFVYAGKTVDEAAYQRCRAAYQAFAAPAQWSSS